MNDKLELMHGLADGQLSPEEQIVAERLVETDAECRAELTWAKFLKSTLPQKCRMDADPEVWKQSLARFDTIDKTRRTEGFVAKYAWVLCVAVVMFIFSGAYVNRVVGSQTVGREQVAELFNPVGTSRTPSPNLSTANALDLRNYSVVGYFEGKAANRPSQYFRLQDRFGSLALVVIAGATNLEGIDNSTGVTGFLSGEMNGANCITWTMRGNTYVLASNRPVSELLDLAQGMVLN